ETASRLGIPHFEADSVYWDGSGREAPDFRVKAERFFLNQTQWVAEGHYGKLKDLLDPRITHLVWLDFSYPIILKQWFLRSLLTRDWGDLPWLTLRRASLIRNYEQGIERAKAHGITIYRMKFRHDLSRFLTETRLSVS